MPILIDGYNLLNATGIVGRGGGPGGLQRSRLALLNFLAASIDAKEVSHTTVVFDAHNPPPGLPRAVSHRGITVVFAGKDETADERIASLIREHSAPRALVVVSSDHAVQRAARRRKAKAVDSDVWYAELIRSRRERETQLNESARPAVPLLEEDVHYWLREFGGESELAKFLAGQLAEENRSGCRIHREEAPRPESESSSEKDSCDGIDNPFPPGYAEDILRDF